MHSRARNVKTIGFLFGIVPMFAIASPLFCLMSIRSEVPAIVSQPALTQ